MFGRNNNMDTTDPVPQDSMAPTAPVARTVTPEPTPRSIAAASPVSSRRSLDLPHGSRRAAPADRDRGPDAGERKLIVGRGLSLSGEITACDVLVVEGKVEAKLADGKLLEIAESGQFRGNVEIENADIAGRYDGDLTVHGRLTIRGTGRISGMVKYGELEVNVGGQIIGEMQVIGSATTSSANAPSFKSAAKFTAQPDEEDDALFSRKAINS